MAVVLLLLGGLVAGQVGAALGLSVEPARIPVERAEAGPGAAAVAPPKLEAIVLPEGTPERVRVAAGAVASALRDRGAAAPAIRESGSGRGLTVAVSGTGASETFRLGRDGDGLRLDAEGPAGAAGGLYTLADRIRSGAAVIPAGQDGVPVTPRLPLRLVDHGSVGLDADPARFAPGTDYGLNTDLVGSALLPDAPWVDTAAAARISGQFHEFVTHSLAQGYNGVVVPGFLEYLTFDGYQGGHAVYPEGDPHPARALALRRAFEPMWRQAHDLGMRIYFQTDMLALSPPLKALLGDRDAADPALWRVYRAGLSELLAAVPYLDGLMVRIGEGGGTYKLDGWDYSSEIAVTTAAQVRTMLTELLAELSPAGKDLIFRSWTVGVGEVGDLHTNPATYAEALDGVDDPHLIVSTKYTLGDFYSHLPLNTTLDGGSHKRIVEFQSRREFEGFGSLPDALGPLHQQALRSFLAANPNIVGLWNWTQDGGPLYAGPRALYLREGFWQLWDVNVYLTGRLAADPGLDVAAATDDWIRATFTDDPGTIKAIGRALALSREAITKGLYIGPYADTRVKALGLEPPPMMWIFEWDIATGDSAALDVVQHVTGDRIDEAIADGGRAADLVTRMHGLIEATPAAAWRDPGARDRFLAATAYERNLFTTLAAYRTTVLRHAQWLATGSSSAKTAWKTAEGDFRTAAADHRSRYGHDTALPAYNFTAAELGLAHADRDLAMAWLARGLLALLLLALAFGGPGHRLIGGRPGAAGLRALWLGLTRPLSAGRVEPGGRTDRLVVWLLPAVLLVASRSVLTAFLSVAHLVATLGAWLLFALVLRLLVRGRDPFALAAAVGGAVLLRVGLLLAALSVRGPGRYWYGFWIRPGERSVYISLAFAAFCWVFVVAALVLRTAYGAGARRAAGGVLTALGVPLLLLGSLVAGLGLERCLTWWNDQMALLPWGLSRILGITTYLGIPTILPTAVAVLGGALVLAGGALRLRRRAGEPG
ncbi:hypothetical protein GCM10010468_03370 [Actinocorallia longicatena]|uniref:Glycosyl hydrolase family 67 n=2 Tax=Actinocorallia longicatena TaxID=111803 RepID=A0ABP6PZ87_9ACTN